MIKFHPAVSSFLVEVVFHFRPVLGAKHWFTVHRWVCFVLQMERSGEDAPAYGARLRAIESWFLVFCLAGSCKGVKQYVLLHKAAK